MRLLNHVQLVNKKIDKELFFARLYPFIAGEIITEYDRGRILEEVITNAQRFFTKIKKTKEFKRKRSYTESDSGSGSRQYKKGGHNGYYRPSPEQLSKAEKNRRFENQFCFNYGKSGHFSNKCSKPRNVQGP